MNKINTDYLKLLWWQYLWRLMVVWEPKIRQQMKEEAENKGVFRKINGCWGGGDGVCSGDGGGEISEVAEAEEEELDGDEAQI